MLEYHFYIKQKSSMTSTKELSNIAKTMATTVQIFQNVLILINGLFWSSRS